MLQTIRKRLNQKGFTLIELMVVIAILGVLAAIAIPRFSSATASANTAKIQADLRTIDSAIITAVAAGKDIKAGDLTQLKDFLTETPSVPKGKCFIGTTETEIGNDWVYAVMEIDGNLRGTLNGQPLSGYGKDAKTPGGKG